MLFKSVAQIHFPEMSDILDEIIDRLLPSTLSLVLEFNSDRPEGNTQLDNLFDYIQKIKMIQVNRDLKRKIFELKSKTTQNRNYLLKLKNELQVLKFLKKTVLNEQSIKAYTAKISELECVMKNLTKDQGDIDLSYLFREIEDLNQQIEEYKKKITEARSKFQCYDNFPPDIEEGKEIIAKIKEKIKQHESVVRSFV